MVVSQTELKITAIINETQMDAFDLKKIKLTLKYMWKCKVFRRVKMILESNS